MTEKIDIEVFQCFLDETSEAFEALSEKIVQLETASDYKDIVEDIFRPVHGVKGNSGFFGLSNILGLAHNLEDLLQDIRSDRISVNEAVVDLLIEGIEILTDAVDKVRSDATLTFLTSEQQGYIDKINQFRAAQIGRHDLTAAIRSLTDTFSDLQQSGIDLSSIPHVSNLCDAISVFIQGASRLLNTPPRKDVQASNRHYYIGNEDVTSQAHCLLELISRLKSKQGASLQTVQSIKDAYRYIHSLLSGELQALVSVKHAWNLFSFLDDRYLNDDDEFIEDINDVIEQLLNHVETRVEETEPKKIGTILRDHGMIDEQDLSEALQKQKKLGQILLDEKKIDRQDLEKALNEQRTRMLTDFNKGTVMAKEQKTIRIQQGKIDDFAFRVGELTTSLDALNYIQKQFSNKYATEPLVNDFKNLSVSLNDASAILEKDIMEIRKVPAKTLTQKISALVRNLAHHVEKSIQTEIMGDDTLIDKDVLEKLGDPIVHIIRNCVDHGIESSPEIREQQGKPKVATIHVKVNADKKDVIIEIADDGKGIDPAVIGKSAVEKGLITENRLGSLSDRDVISYIFQPGFSTSKEVTDISGRGVGLDVVKKNIESLGGQVDIDSHVGRGTVFSLTIPITQTLLTKEALFIEENGTTFAIPSEPIDRVVSIVPNAIRKHKDILISEVNNHLYSFKKLDAYFNASMAAKLNNDAQKPICGILLKGHKAGLLVDKVIGYSKIVVKDADMDCFKYATLLDGFTITGEGKVVMIVKIDHVVSDIEAVKM